MSFVWFADKPLRTREEIAAEVHKVSLARGLDELATVIALMTISTEAGADDKDGNRQWWCPWNEADAASKNYPYDSQSDDGRSVGYFQQQQPWWNGTASEMTLPMAANVFLSRLTNNWQQAKDNPTLAGQFAQQVQGSAFPDRYAEKWDEAWQVLNNALGTAAPSPSPAPAPEPAPEPVQPPQEAPVGNRPDFNEYPRWCTNFESRSGTKPDLFLLHTEEGNDNADGLASFLISTENGANPVSYHYTISEDPNDHGVTVCDVVDTDEASWSVMSSNHRSINLCFAGSSVNWSRDQWMQQDKAIDVAAYLAVQDCKKYGFPPNVIVDPYADPPGIADHEYCGNYLHDGNNHSDVGPNFPWDYFKERVAFWAADAPAPAPAPEPEPAPVPTPPATDEFGSWLATANDTDLLRYIAAQLGPGDPSWASKGKTLRDKVWGL